ncbi:MAG: hypothetical protein BWY74_00785 [Firmicutes bacterium ADurb.Bin419]|nr:MAG: hypothetical protein BWY74_00785 [Firmicutes bacterium ADurb.Bin419]
MATWKQVKLQKAIRLGGWYCQICGCYLGDKGRYANGHHIDNNHDHININNCELRCVDCEQWAHQIRKDGNPSKKQIDEWLRNGRW